MGWLRFILSHSIFVALCAVALCYQTYTVLLIQPDALLYGFVFFATLCSYNFYWLAGKFHYRRQKSIVAFIKANTSYLIVFLLSSIAMLYIAIKLTYLFPWMLVAGMLTFIYSTPLWNENAKAIAAKTGFFKTVLLSLTWALVTVIFPAQELLQTDKSILVILLFFARFFLMLMLCLIFDMRDIHLDKMHGLHSLATDVSRQWLQVIMVSAFCIYVIAGLLVRMNLADNKQLIAHLVTGLIVWIVYRRSTKKQGYLFYYFLVDGLMLIASLTTFIAAQV
jgi:4-hydroxybenzoate polyprenyltransferase